MTKPDSKEERDAGYRRVRLEDIATRCRTSLSTVSRALSGEKGVSHELRTRIQAVARAMRYTPAQELCGARIVLAISQVAMLDYNRYQFSWYVLQGLKERAKVLGVDLITHPLNDNNNGALQALLEEPDVGGVLALTVDVCLKRKTDPFRLPSVNPPCHSVNSKYRIAASNAQHYLPLN
ncbi:LacI family DNA-binding transcriptional regulator [Dickeya oryzae]|uniref:LacI family DNA-binding transcriptional regulator n=1 Tax=Dickeya oryzae TaxID=1240404 RepID=UPI00039E1382|nr:LacI family DNA-binding transcriptional regulator [Dickeya oryzae]MCA6992584.1 LacI family DNA-binding transcriptional regulator [Dickeya oryzae]